MQQLPIIGKIKRSRDIFQIAKHIGNEKRALDPFFRRKLLGALDRRRSAIHSRDIKPPARKPHCAVAGATAEINRSAGSSLPTPVPRCVRGAKVASTFLSSAQTTPSGIRRGTAADGQAGAASAIRWPRLPLRRRDRPIRWMYSCYEAITTCGRGPTTKVGERGLRSAAYHEGQHVNTCLERSANKAPKGRNR
jgi:hypothetical protein